MILFETTMKNVFALLAISLLSSSAQALSPAEVMTDIEQRARVSGKNLTLFGLYPGMTRPEAISVAKQADKIRVLKEKAFPKMAFYITLFHPTRQ